LGFRVSELGFRVSGFGFRVSGFGFRVEGDGARGYLELKEVPACGVVRNCVDFAGKNVLLVTHPVIVPAKVLRLGVRFR
jgi:hypothetical protein